MEKAHSQRGHMVKEKPENFLSYLCLKHFDTTNLTSPANHKTTLQPKNIKYEPKSERLVVIGGKGAYEEENSSTD